MHLPVKFDALAILASSALADETRGLIHYRPVERDAPKTLEADIAVYGGTPGGFAAALQAARLGKNVVLLSFDPYVGGLTSAGLTATDVGKKSAIGGMAMEFYNRAGKLVDFSPSKAEATFRAMLEEAGVTVLTGRPLESVAMDGTINSTIETHPGVDLLE